MKTPTTLIIMDGFGIAPKSEANAISAAKTPYLLELFKSGPRTQLEASGEDVGLPAGQIGNSEVGHTNIGAGRVVFQELPRISNEIKDGSFFENEVIENAMETARSRGGAVHLMGLMSDGGVHSHNTHTWAFIEMAKKLGVEKVYIHCFMDGRDVLPTSGKGFIEECVEKCAEIGLGKIATVMGRFYAMDRDNRWERIEKAYNAITCGEGEYNPDPVDAMEKSYAAGVTDEFVVPVVCDKDGVVKDGDAVFFTNFRPDRARELTRAFVDRDFSGFTRKTGLLDIKFVCATQYDEKITGVDIAFPSEHPEKTLGEVLSGLGLTQLRIAETEKYAHVTFFFNGGEEKPFEGEDRVLIPSPKEYPTYDLIPEMSAYKVAEEACKRIKSRKYDVVIINFANCDMVGHTGVFDATVKAVETVDECVRQVAEATLDMGGIAIVTADHGNADKMIDDDGKTPHTAHTTNPVPFVIAGASREMHLARGRLADIAPTILELMGIDKPEQMTGRSLISY